MPIYEYRCQRCGERLEAMRRLADAPLTVCPACGGELRKLVSAPAFQFKGSGWYVTDYARKAGPGTQGAAETATGSTAPKEGGDKADGAGDKPAATGGTAADDKPAATKPSSD
jgi:putative FmdB family regulatory protein